MDRSSSLSFLASLKELASIRNFVDETGSAWGADPTALSDVVQAVDEAATNVIVHGYLGQPGAIEIEMCQEGVNLRICLRDQAPPFNPELVMPPDLTLPLEERPYGGMGIFLIRQYMDELNYSPLPLGGNELALVKYGIFRSREEEAADEHHR